MKYQYLGKIIFVGNIKELDILLKKCKTKLSLIVPSCGVEEKQ